jgi:hypothetical protein
MQLIKNYKFKGNEKDYKKKHYLINKNKYKKLNKLWKKNNPEKVKKLQRMYYKRNNKEIKEKSKYFRTVNAKTIKRSNRKYVLKKNYNLTIEQYEQMLKKQDYKCMICKKHRKEFNKDLSVDHCHTTNKVRDLLCYRCNLAVGYYENSDIKTIKEYLNKHKEKLN